MVLCVKYVEGWEGYNRFYCVVVCLYCFVPTQSTVSFKNMTVLPHILFCYSFAVYCFCEVCFSFLSFSFQ